MLTAFRREPALTYPWSIDAPESRDLTTNAPCRTLPAVLFGEGQAGIACLAFLRLRRHRLPAGVPKVRFGRPYMRPDA